MSSIRTPLYCTKRPVFFLSSARKSAVIESCYCKGERLKCAPSLLKRARGPLSHLALNAASNSSGEYPIRRAAHFISRLARRSTHATSENCVCYVHTRRARQTAGGKAHNTAHFSRIMPKSMGFNHTAIAAQSAVDAPDGGKHKRAEEMTGKHGRITLPRFSFTLFIYKYIYRWIDW